MARLGDIATYINGFAFKPSDWSDSGVPIIRIQDLTGNSYQANRYSGEYDKKYEVLPGDVLISWSASLGIYVWTGERAVLNQHIFKVVFDKCEVDKSFFVHQVQNILEKAASSAHGATMKHLTKPVFDALPFYLPPLEEQRRIAALLDKVSDLIAKRRAQLDKLDLLVKARFVEMFGDPLLDSGKYPKVPLGSLAEVGSSKRIFEKEYVSEGVPFYRTKEIVELSKGNRITTELFITRERYDEISREYGVPQTGDLLISAVGTIGVIWIVDGKNDFYFKDGNLLRVVTSEKFVPIYLKHLLESLIGAYKLEMSSGTAYAALTISALKELLVYEVPIAEQEQFAIFVEQIDKSKLTIQQSLDKLETLRKSLMQEYFG
ncbi:hypothetical protein LAWASA_2808 [Lawsonibacter asaccharolyticus]|nr:hypothetical protein LAWASA_2808 [Lawsonibacter asaccharolyticus]